MPGALCGSINPTLETASGVKKGFYLFIYFSLMSRIAPVVL
jgi:hypothetical protein